VKKDARVPWKVVCGALEYYQVLTGILLMLTVPGRLHGNLGHLGIGKRGFYQLRGHEL
jgi:hypothetical protein